MIKVILKLISVASIIICNTQANPTDLFNHQLLPPAIPALSPIEGSEISYRLPNNTYPKHYEISIRTDIHLPDETDPQKYKFSGNVVILLTPLLETDFITIHARLLQNLKGKLYQAGVVDPIALKDEGTPEIQEEQDFITYRLLDSTKKLMPDKNYILEIEFNGELASDGVGFYRTKYSTESGETRWLAATQFEYTFARKAFPCYDELSKRALFRISINHDKSYRALSNMPVLELQPDKSTDDRVTTIFQQTVKSHPSVVAFIITDFIYVEKIVENETPQRVYSTPQAINSGLGDFGLDLGIKMLRYLENYLEIKFSLPKLDQISIPNFIAGGMENWGLINYREETLLLNPNTVSLTAKNRLVTILGHEYAHQYFGNLVTMEWWSVAWLKEGFATYFEFTANAVLYPELHNDDYFVIKAVHGSLDSDALESTRPMTYYVEDPYSIAAASDFVVYQKAASVIRMWQHTLTEPVFRKGLQNFLNDMAYEAASPDDLARNLQLAVNETGGTLEVKDLIESWSLKSGFPVVHVTLLADNKLRLSQSKFSYTKPIESKELFMIPVSFTTANKSDFHDTLPKVWLNGESVDVSPSTGNSWSKDDWVIVNIQESGYYRVNYDNDLWEQIRKKLWSDSFEDIHHLNRAQLVDDALNLARGGYVRYDIALALTQYLSKEKHFAPWTAANRGFDYLNRLLIDSKNYKNFKRFINELVTPLYKDLTINDGGASEEIDVKDKRNIAIRWACLTGDQNCVKESTAKVNDIINNSEKEKEIEANSRQAIYCNGLREANEATFDGMVEKLQKTSDLGDRIILFYAIGCTQDAKLQKKYLDSSISETGNNYLSQERAFILDSVTVNGGKNGVETSIEFLIENWETVEEMYGNILPLTIAVNKLAVMVTSEEINKKFTELLETLLKAEKLSDKEVSAIYATVKSNIDWVGSYDTFIKDFFDRLYNSSAKVSASFTIVLTIFVTVYSFLM